MRDFDRYHNVMRALAEGTVYDVAHALIPFEEIPIHESINKIVAWIHEKPIAVTGRPLRPELYDKLNQAVEIRRARLGDALWFSHH